MVEEWKAALKKLLNYGGVNFTEQVMRLVLIVGTVISTVALFFDVFVTRIGIYSLPSAIILATMLAADTLMFRYGKVRLAQDLICVNLVLVVLPGVFLLNGGVDGGAVPWLILGMMFLLLVYKGRKLVVFMVLDILIDTSVYIFAYFHPEYVVTYENRQDVFIDSIVSMFLVGLAIGFIIKFQLSLYNNQIKLIEEQKRELEEASRERDMFFANMSHELRTPINSIIGFNEINLREQTSEEMTDNSLNIKNSSMLLLSLVNDILDLSKIQSQKMEIVPVNYDVAAFFRDLVDMTKVSAAEKRLDMRVNIDESIPRTLRSDEGKLRQIAVNIVTNAIKYTDEGSVTIHVGGTRISDYVYRMEFTVVDTGVGIKKEDIDHIYDAFRRINERDRRRTVGTGLGLAICKELVHMMGGTITVDSIYTKGSTFRVVLDQEIVNPEPVGRLSLIDTRRKKAENYYTQSFEASEARILVVDDDNLNRKVIRSLLTYTKVIVEEASDWRQCLEMTMKKYYNVILMDYMMREKDGAELFLDIRNQENGLCRETPVILLSAASASIEKKLVDEYGFDGFLSKPVEPIALERTILSLLPEDLVEYRLKPETGAEDSGREVSYGGKKKKKILITTENISDVTPEDIEEYHIGVISLYIKTASGTFKDGVEIDNFNMAKYVEMGMGTIKAFAPTLEDYEQFFAQKLLEADDVIHISLGKHIGQSYENALSASKGFDHVHVVDSGQFSGGMAMVVKAAARDAAGGASVRTVIGNVQTLSKRIMTMVYLPEVSLFYENNFMSRALYNFIRRSNLHLRVVVRNSGFKFAGFYVGRNENARKRFMSRGYLPRRLFDTRECYLGHVEIPQRELKAIRNELEKDMRFETIHINDVSVASACNAGVGAMCFSVLLNR